MPLTGDVIYKGANGNSIDRASLELQYEQDKHNFYLAHEYQDFKDFLADEIGIDYLNQLFEKFKNRP